MNKRLEEDEKRMSEEVKECITVSKEASKKVERCADNEEVNTWVDAGAPNRGDRSPLRQRGEG